MRPFSYVPPKAKDDGVRRDNLWRANDERGDRRKYTELMEEKQLHAEKGAISGELLSSSLGLAAPEQRLEVSAAFISQLAATSAPSPKRQRGSGPSFGTSAATYEVGEEDAESVRTWEQQQLLRQQREDAAAARRKKKRERKKAAKMNRPIIPAEAGEGAAVEAATDDEGAAVEAATDDEGAAVEAATDDEGAAVKAATDDEGAATRC